MNVMTISAEALALMADDPDFAGYLKQEPGVGDVHQPSSGGGKPKKKKPADFQSLISTVGDLPGDRPVRKELDALLAEMEAAHQAEREMLKRFGLTYDEPKVHEVDKQSATRHLRPHEDGGAYSPFPHDPNAMNNLHPEQMRRFLDALTDQDSLPDRRVGMNTLVALQPRVDPDKVDSMGRMLLDGKVQKMDLKKPLVVRASGKNYLADGHHRAAAHWLAGAKAIDCKFADLSGDDEELTKEWQIDLPIFKAAGGDDLTGRMVFGIASMISEGGKLVVDKQGDIIAPRELENAFYNYLLEGGQHGEMHKFVGTGRCIAGYVITDEHKRAIAKAGYKLSLTNKAGEECEGLIAGWVVDEPTTLEKIKSGELPELSIGGTGLRVNID